MKQSDMDTAIDILEDALILQAAKVKRSTSESFGGDTEQALEDLAGIISQIRALNHILHD